MYSQNFACQPNQNKHRGRKKSVTAAGKSFTFRRRSSLINYYCKNIVQQSDLLIIIVYSVRGEFHDHGPAGTRNARKDMHNGQACGRNSGSASACDSPTMFAD